MKKVNLFQLGNEQASRLEVVAARMHASKFAATENEITFPAHSLNSEEVIDKLCALIPTESRGKSEKKVLYTIETDNVKATLKAYDAYRQTLPPTEKGKTTNPHSLSRRNKTHLDSSFLYVGSSALSGIRSRFKRHCGYYQGHDRTYGLKMKKWLANEEVAITLRYWILLEDFGELNQTVLQLLEDGLWEESKPLFGKKGQA